MGLIIDLIVLAIVILACFLSAKQGFVKVFVEAIGIVAAIFVVLTFATPVSNTTYDKYIEPPIVSAVVGVAEDSADGVAESLSENIPEFLQGKFQIEEKISEFSDNEIGENTESFAKEMSQTVVKPIAVKIISLVFSLVFLIIALVLVKIIAKFVNKLFSFSIVGKLNSILGGAVGILKGVVLALIFCMIISLITSFTPNGFLIFTPENLGNSFIFTTFSGLNPFSNTTII